MFWRREEPPWFAVPGRFDSAEDQLAWRRAVLEVARITGDRVPLSMPGEQVFCCRECCGPTVDPICVECAYDMGLTRVGLP